VRKSCARDGKFADAAFPKTGGRFGLTRDRGMVCEAAHDEGPAGRGDFQALLFPI